MQIVRRLLPMVVAVLVCLVGFNVSRRVGWFSVVGVGVAFLLVRGLLPRLAHRAFVRGQFKRSAFFYRSQRVLRLSPEARTAARLSLVACRMDSSPRRALNELVSFSEAALPESVKAVLWNNRAYLQARLKSDLNGALDLVCKAIELRPALHGFLHTRGLVLLAMGRPREALVDFDAAWRAQSMRSPSHHFESERSFDVGRAWFDRNEIELAHQYWRRSWQSSAKSRWGLEAQQRLRGSMIET